ncbi:hypothetical protein H0I39_06520 [Ottowia beijingensis]|uniref:Acyltransferase 3 domain-containing protein n=1 Tax=Ottowia beijingensis TaxID=1207057 RepID=A0A853IVG2_9BURK|nr:hypothetical protein [Ottowia beijingensis]NZA01507.1 hypothetical protein [Ottowia beijingensis]
MFAIEWLFVLSGFLIGSMMIRSFEARDGWWASARDFWLRRWFRTIPNYYLFLALNAALAWWGIEEGRFDWSFAVFSQNLAWAQEKPLFFAEAWSLALDEWFYFLMPILIGVVAWMRHLERRHLFWAVALVLILIPSVLRSIITPPAHFFEWDDHVRRVTIMHLDATGWAWRRPSSTAGMAPGGESPGLQGADRCSVAAWGSGRHVLLHARRLARLCRRALQRSGAHCRPLRGGRADAAVALQSPGAVTCPAPAGGQGR